MTDETNAEKKEEQGKTDSVPTGKTDPVDPPSPPVVSTGTQEQVAGKPGSEKPADKCDKSKEILVRVLEDDALSAFETKTLFWGKVGIFLAIATFVVGILTLIVFYCQLSLTQTQLQDAESDGRSAARHARQQIGVLQSQVEAITKQMRQDQRAWVSYGVETAHTTGVPPVGHPFMIRVTFTNTGKTPALNVKTCISVQTLAKGQLPTFACPTYAPQGVIFPGSLTYGDALISRSLGEDDRNKIISDTRNVWVYGRSEYHDVFARKHWFTFCYHLLSGGGYAICEGHHEIDTNE